jgi:hypothetical protein
MGTMAARLFAGLFLILPAFTQQLVVDRGPGGTPPDAQPVERSAGYFGDAFRIGAAGETWMIDSIRLWALPPDTVACPKELGDAIAKLTLMGALDNPPVPGQPVCDCHALVPIAAATLAGGSSRSLNSSAALTLEKGVWRIDFRDMRWSVPGDTDVLFSLRATSRKEGACRAAAEWKLAAGPASAEYRLHLLDKAGVPEGLAGPQTNPRAIHIQVWAHRTRP